MSKPDKKHRRELKRKQKRKDMKKRDGISPAKRLTDAPGEAECWMSDTLANVGQAMVFCYKRGAGLTGMACFLIDRGIAGLKDAWIKLNIEYPGFKEMLNYHLKQGTPTRRATVEEARALVAGAVRWAHDYGMRLPVDWPKATAFLGGLGDWKSADVSQFVKEFAGHPEDLRQRLIGQSLDSLAERGDVNIIFNSDAPYAGLKHNVFVGDDEDSDLDDFDDEDSQDIDSFDDNP